jgi:hypothetical protein
MPGVADMRALTQPSAVRARPARQRDHVADQVAQQHGATAMQVGDRKHAAFAVRQAQATVRVDDFEVIEIGRDVLGRRVIGALHQAALHLGEGIASADVDGGRTAARQQCL